MPQCYLYFPLCSVSVWHAYGISPEICNNFQVLSDLKVNSLEILGRLGAWMQVLKSECMRACQDRVGEETQE